MFETPEFFQKARPSAGKLNQLSDLSAKIMSSRLAGNGSVSGFGILTADQLSESFWAKVTDNDGGTPSAHSWVQIVETEATVYEQQADGMYGDKVNLPLYDINGALLPDNLIVRIWRGQGDYYLTESSNGMGWVMPTTSSPSTVSLGRTIMDGVITAGQSTLSSGTADFTSADTGRTLIGTGIPGSTTILTVLSSTEVQMSNSATSTQTADTVNIQSGTIPCYSSSLVAWSNVTGAWSVLETVWFLGVNGEVPVPNMRYLCKQLGIDAGSVPIWGDQFACIGGVDLQTGTTYTFVQADLGKLVSFSNASAIAATLPQATSTISNFGPRWFIDVENRGAGTLTITPTTSTIDGVSTLALTTNQGVRIFSDGTNYYTQRGMASGGGGGSNLTLLDKSGTTVDAACTSLKADSRGIFTYTHLAANSDQVVITDASPTQAGVVNTTTQSFLGNKTFESGITINSGGSNPNVVMTENGLLGFQANFTNNSGTSSGNLDVDNSSGLSWSNAVSAFIANGNTGDFFIGNGSLTTTATSGFCWLSGGAGPPTGVPLGAGSGWTPAYIDTTNHKLYGYFTGGAGWVLL